MNAYTTLVVKTKPKENGKQVDLFKLRSAATQEQVKTTIGGYLL